MDPIVIVPEGIHNSDIKKAQERLRKGGQYQDLSTVIICPTRGVIPARVVESWMNLMRPMNNKVYGPIFIAGAEVGAAYETAVELVVANPELSKWKYMLTIEEDNIPPADGLLKLYESICQCKKLCGEHYGAVGGLYWTKGEAGQPMIYGNPKGLLSFEPQIPLPDKVQEANGLGMGFTLFRLDLFKDDAIERPWFRSVQAVNEGQGTQDLYFFNKMRKAGYRLASDNRVRVGHYSLEDDRVW